MIDEADRVTLFCGSGTAGAHAEVMEFAERVKSPVGHALRGKEWIQYDNPYDVGMSGLLGYGAAYEATHECDLLILLGTDFPYNAFLPDDVKIVQVDVRPEHLGRRSKLDLAVWGDVRETLRVSDPAGCGPKTDRRFLDRMLKKHADALEGVVKAYTRKVEKHIPIHPEYVASVLDEVAADDAVFTVDTGMCNVWAARYLTPNGRRRVIGSFSHGSMANALPQAIGAQFIDREPPGRLDVGRRRILHADGRLPHPRPVRPAGEGRPVQQLLAGHGGAGDAGRRPARRTAPTNQQPGLRGHRPRGRGVRRPGGEAQAAARARCRTPSSTRARPWSTSSPTPTPCPSRRRSAPRW